MFVKWQHCNDMNACRLYYNNTLIKHTFCFQEVSQLASSLYTTGTNLSRSVSSAGEHQSETYVSPILPKRAETFGGFDTSNQGPLKLAGKKLHSSGGTPAGTPDVEILKPGDARLFVSTFYVTVHINCLTKFLHYAKTC